jgi:hypothetical protein
VREIAGARIGLRNGIEELFRHGYQPRPARGDIWFTQLSLTH